MTTQEHARCRLLNVDAHSCNLAEIRRFAGSVAAEADLDNERTFDLKVAVSEACANAVEHSGADPCPVQITAWFYPDRLQLDIRDDGGFRLPSIAANTRRENRGLGFPLMVALMDEVRVAKRPDGGTQVTLVLYYSCRHPD
jgi:serine/threonine-protein kinase RsbW